MFDTITWILLCLALLYLVYVIVEKLVIDKRRKKLRLVVHVNGIRGKSTVTRLIDAGLRGCGYKVFSKTTGTLPMTIDVNNNAKVIKRLGPANVREQKKALGWAVKQGAEALVVECMAVNPELQYLCEHRILNSNVVVVTNVRSDHLDEMGPDLKSIAYSLANTVPSNGTLVLGDGKYVDVFQEVAHKTNAKVVVARGSYSAEDFDTFEENIVTAMQVCKALGLDEKAFLQGMKSYHRDPGALCDYKIDNTVFINGFSVNDPDSTLSVYDFVCQRYPAEQMTVLLNTRPDRPFRVKQHIEMLTKIKCKEVLICGSNQDYVAKQLAQLGVQAHKISKIEELLNYKYVFGCGNIANMGMQIVDYFKNNGETL
ncbi:MAG: poly-gamma-glutamate synthase PgsB [Clostridia bacterium]|nr:poly-gamma-glutamate synthase PgsB [Clostridia bacterium]